MFSRLIATPLVFGMVALSAHAAEINVPAEEPTIQAAIDFADHGDVVLVAPGIYRERINFLGKSIEVRSSHGAAETTIGLPGNVMETLTGWAYRTPFGPIVSCTNNESPKTVLSGFTITGGAAALGGGMFNSYSRPTVTDCVFVNNLAEQLGGGICNLNSDASVTNCTFTRNIANYGGGIHNNRSDAALANCVFNGNEAEARGGGISNIESDPTVTNCTFSSNLAAEQGGAIDNDRSFPRLTNSVLWGDSPDEVTNCSVSAPFVGHSVIAANLPAGAVDLGNNADTDPLFRDAAGEDTHPGTMDDDLRLEADSDCINAGDNRSVPDGLWADMDGNPRIVNRHVDMGAYEDYQIGDCVSKAACPEADIDCDSFVDGLDIAMITSSANWGKSAASAANPYADVNLDGMVNGLDLASARASGCFGY